MEAVTDGGLQIPQQLFAARRARAVNRQRHVIALAGCLELAEQALSEIARLGQDGVVHARQLSGGLVLAQEPDGVVLGLLHIRLVKWIDASTQPATATATSQ